MKYIIIAAAVIAVLIVLKVIGDRTKERRRIMGFEDRLADLKRMDLSATYDYSTFRYVSIFEAGAKRVSDEDYEVVPDEYKSINPLKKGAYSLLWIIFTVITLILSFYTLIVPEKQQFVEDIPFDNQFLKKIPTNVPVRLYFENEFTEMVKYCKIL